MKKYLSMFLIICLFPAYSFCQAATLKGLILDAETSIPISFATVGLVGQQVGTVTNEEGRFKVKLDKINSNEVHEAEFVFSCVGYQSLKVNFNELELEREIVIKLQPIIFEMDEIAVSPKRSKEKIYGNRGRARLTSLSIFNRYSHADDALGKEVGRIIKIDKDIKLEEFGFYVYGSAFASVKFRLNLYDFSTSIPRKIYLEKDIVFDIDIEKGWFTIDLASFNIRLKDLRLLTRIDFLC